MNKTFGFLIGIPSWLITDKTVRESIMDVNLGKRSKEQVERNGGEAGRNCDRVEVQYKEGRLPPLPIDLEKNPATLKSHFSSWAVVCSIGIAD